MTLSQRASVPLALRTAGSPELLPEVQHSATAQATPAPPLSLKDFLECWMIQHGASLQRLSLAGCGAWVTDEQLQIVTKYCKDSLVCLDLCGCAQLSDWSISNCLCDCQSLTTVSLAMMGQLSSEALAHYAPSEPAAHETELETVPLPCALQRLDLTGCGGIGWFGLETAFRSIGAGLLELSLRGQVAMPADGIVNVLRRCPNLKQLDVSCCLSIDDSTVAEICSICPQLRTLAISACPAVAMPNNVGKSPDPFASTKAQRPLCCYGFHALNSRDARAAACIGQSPQWVQDAKISRLCPSPAALKSAHMMGYQRCYRAFHSLNVLT